MTELRDAENAGEEEEEESELDADDLDVLSSEEDECFEEDWSQTFDDSDGAYWESYFDVDDEEWDHEMCCELEDVVGEGGDSWPRAPLSRERSYAHGPDLPEDARRVAILRWLKTSKFPKPFAWGAEGFLVQDGQFGTLRSGERVNVVAWLRKEGVDRPYLLDGYEVRYLTTIGRGACIMCWLRAARS